MKDFLNPNALVIKSLFGMLVVLLAAGSVFAQDAGSDTRAKDPEGLVRELYDQVTFPVGESPDWSHVRNMFINEATVTMRTGRETTATLSLDGWILDFVNFINDREVKKTGFEEKIVKMRSMVFGDIAHVLVLYTAQIPGVTKMPQEGVDSFHLIRKEGRWRIVSILNEIPTKDRSRPEVLN